MRVARSFAVENTPQGPIMRVFDDGINVLRNPLTNKGSAFTEEERRALGVEGYLPPRVATIEEQLARAFRNFSREPTNLAKHQYLRALLDRNETLFYALLTQHPAEMLPIVYTPTVGEAIRHYSRLFRTPRGLTFTTANAERAYEILSAQPLEDVRMIVATDSSAILGIGDQGYGGIAISIGKLALYTLGGLAPYHGLPVSLDVGTDRDELREDELYLGIREPRLRGTSYLALMDQFVDAVHARFPRAILQWEDLAKDTAFDVLARYRRRHPSFNDDIQGTGAVALGGLLRGAELTKKPLREQTFVLHGAGAGGVGVALAIIGGLVREGLTRDEARARVFVLDSKGLLTQDRKMESYKLEVAQSRESLAAWTVAGELPTLLETIENAKATVLIGLSGQGGAFERKAIEAVASHCERPMIFPLSNPTDSCEALPSDVLAWTNGRALVATGSPFDPVTLADGSVHAIGQGNNAFIFPGLGLGASLAAVREVSDGMVSAAAYALADYTRKKHPTRLYPPIDELREVAICVASRVIAQAEHEGFATAPPGLANEDAVRARVYVPAYLPVRRG